MWVASTLVSWVVLCSFVPFKYSNFRNPGSSIWSPNFQRGYMDTKRIPTNPQARITTQRRMRVHFPCPLKSYPTKSEYHVFKVPIGAMVIWSACLKMPIVLAVFPNILVSQLPLRGKCRCSRVRSPFLHRRRGTRLGALRLPFPRPPEIKQTKDHMKSQVESSFHEAARTLRFLPEKIFNSLTKSLQCF